MDQRSTPNDGLEQNSLLADIATRNVICLAAASSVGAAARIMRERRISSIVVTDEAARPAGIVTERNILLAMQAGYPHDTLLPDIMSSPVITVPRTTTTLDAYRLCLSRGIRHLVVVDENGQLAGVASETDFRLHLNLTALAGRRKVISVAKRSAVVLPPSSSLQQALDLMLAQHKSCALVVDSEKPVGIVTERDVVRFYSGGRRYADITLGEIMVSPVHTIPHDATTSQAAEEMLVRKLRHLVVVDVAGCLVGLVSEHDLTQAMAGGMAEERDGIEENFLHTLINTLPDLVWLKDADGVFLACNARFEQLCGAPEAKIAGKTDYDFVSRELADSFREHDHRAVAAGGPSVNEEWLTFATDGYRGLFETVKTPMYDQHGKLLGVLGVAREITERVLAEQTVRKLNADLSATLQAIPDLMFELDRDGRYLQVWAHDPGKLAAQQSTLPGRSVGEMLPPEAAATVLAAIAEAHQNGYSGGQVIRLDLPQGESWFELSTAAKCGGTFIMMSRDITRRKKVEAGLAESEEMLRTLIEAIPDSVQFKDGEGRWLAANLSARRAFGLGDCDCRGKTDLELSEIADPRFQKSLRQCHDTDAAAWQAGSITRLEEAIPMADGSSVVYDVIKNPLFAEDGRRKALVIVGRDVTGIKQTESALRNSLADYSELVQRIPVGVFKLRLQPDGATVFDYVSPRWCEMNGLSNEEVAQCADAACAIIHPDEREDFLNLYKDPSVLLRWEGRIQKRDGDTRWMHIEAQPTLLDNGDILWDGIQYDITDRRIAEDTLRITASVFDTSQEAILITDADNAIIDVNPAFTRITGYSREEVIGMNPKLLSSGRQDQVFYQAMWRALQAGGSWRGEIWNRRKNGEAYAELLSISVLRNADGSVQRHVGVFSDISQIKQHEAELSRVAHYDALTGIPNRVLLADRMKQAIAQTARDQDMMAVCYLDLDGFKPINDSLGHDAGDQVLIEVAQRIARTIRGGDTVARLGGDEFVILLLGLARAEECVGTLERLLHAIAQPITIDGRSTIVGASIGVSIYPLDNEEADTLLRHADQAMYLAKQAGKHCFHIYDPSLDQRARDYNEFMKNVRSALELNQFELYYQPKINLKSRQLLGAEALIRWHHPQQGLLPPTDFLHAIENTELDIRVGEWVIDSALAQLRQWWQAGLDIEISINISAYHLESPGFVEMLRQKLARYPELPAGSLQVEVLETTALEDIAAVNSIINACHAFGVWFALDDFGTGYSSLFYLSRLPVDVLKIDQSFVRDMLEDRGDMAIVQGIIALAHAFDRQIVAEGIETAAHYRTLVELGCEIGQGFGIARPMPAQELAHWHAGQTVPG